MTIVSSITGWRSPGWRRSRLQPCTMMIIVNERAGRQLPSELTPLRRLSWNVVMVRDLMTGARWRAGKPPSVRATVGFQMLCP